MTNGRGLLIAITGLVLSGAAMIWLGSGSGPQALGWLVLASIAGVVATGGVGRRLIAVVVLLAGAAAIVLGIAQGVSALPIVLAGAVAVVVSVLIWIYGGQWPGLSTRYRTPRDRPTDPWTELDAGRDPTA